MVSDWMRSGPLGDGEVAAPAPAGMVGTVGGSRGFWAFATIPAVATVPNTAKRCTRRIGMIWPPNQAISCGAVESSIPQSNEISMVRDSAPL